MILRFLLLNRSKWIPLEFTNYYTVNVVNILPPSFVKQARYGYVESWKRKLNKGNWRKPQIKCYIGIQNIISSLNHKSSFESFCVTKYSTFSVNVFFFVIYWDTHWQNLNITLWECELFKESSRSLQFS